MNANENIINNFANTLRNHRAHSKVSLYGENQSRGNSGVEKLNIKDVISSVANQLKAIQNADSVRKLPCGRDIQNLVQKSHFLSVHNLIPQDQPPKQTHKFETQCVLDTQLINIIEDAEAIIDVEKGMTQEFDTTFYHTDLENCNNNMVDNKVFHLIATSSNHAVDNKTIKVSKSKDLSQSDKDGTHSKSPDSNKRIIEDVGNGMTQEFDTTFYHKDIDNAEENNDKYYFIENQNSCQDMLKMGKGNFQRVNLKGTDYEVNYTSNQGPCAINILTPTKVSYSPITDLVLNRDMQQKYLCDFEKQSNFNIIIQDDDNNNYRQEEIITTCNSFVEGPTSPILNKIQPKIKSNTPSPLIFKLETFEKFEKIVMPVIGTHDFETAKRVINSQILNKELFIYTHDEAVLSDRDKAGTDIKNKESKHSAKDDSIHFSSDEEQNNSELTFTCTLQNSLKYKPEISDEIMYVGFQTGSNKPIQISLDSYCKAKSIFENITNIDRENLDSNVFQHPDFDDDSKNKVSDGNDLTLLEYHMSDSKSGNVLVEDNSKKETNKLIIDTQVQDNFENCTERLIDDNLLEEFNTDLILDHKINKPPVIETPSIVDTDTTSIPDNATKEEKANNDFVGFKTAKNKMIKVSALALMTTKNIIETFNKDDDCLTHKSEKRSFEKSHSLQNKSNREKSALKKYTTRDTHLNIVSCPASYENNVNKIRVMWDNRENESQNNIISKSFEIKADNMKNKPYSSHNLDPNYMLQGLKTAINKSVETSKNAFAKTINIFQDIVENSERFDNDIGVVIPSSNTFEGFKTASDKPVKISKSALAKTKVMFQDIFQNNETFVNVGDTVVQSSNTFKGFTTANNKPIKISESALTKTKNIFQGIVQNEEIFDNDRDTVVKSSNLLKGFTTASNKPVEVSDNSFGKTNNIFQDTIKSDEVFDDGLNAVVQLSSAFQGFKTASNKPVNISKKALTKTKNVLQDIVENVEINNVMFNCPGFTSTNNKPLSISEKRLEKCKDNFQSIFDNKAQSKKFNNIDNPASNYDDIKPQYQGFKTASNKSVKVSEEALFKTKNIFQDINIEDYYESKNMCDDLDNTFKEKHPYATENKSRNPLFHGFKTAVNMPVEIFTDCLAKSKKDIEDHEENDNRDYIFKEQQRYPTPNKSQNHIFQGFKTASNKPVDLSLDALAKSKKIFENMDMDCAELQPSKEIGKQTELGPKPRSFFGFNTANNKKVNISEEALSKSKQLLQNVDLDLKIENISPSNLKPKIQSSTEIHVSKEVLKKSRNYLNEFKKSNDDFKIDTDIICENDMFDFNTEIIKEFEATVYTEDFIKTETPKSKRSGSPILSCPKAKKKKFVTPIINNKFVAPINRKSTIETVTSNMYEFNENYKKCKEYTLKDVNVMEKLKNIRNVDPYVLNFKFDTLLDFVFTGNRNDIASDSWTTDKIKKIFTDSVNKRIIPDGWIENHLKLIIWKLLSYEICFPWTMGIVCTVKNVLEQLMYRYKRELYNVERPALRKILEKDEVSTRRMILCVAGLFVDGVSLSSIKNQTQNIELLLTDGWYTVKACTDRMIDRLVCEGKIGVGTKLVVHGAELLNCEQGIAPWEDTSSVRLKISGNATRRAKWDARLGFHGNGAILSGLSAVKPDGGKISRLRALVTRVYPSLYIEKFPDGSTLTRSERLEHIYQMKYETERQMQMEKLYEELGRFSDQESQDSEGVDDGALDSGSQISRMIRRSRDRDEIRADLTNTQTRLLQERAIKKNDKLIQVLQDKFQELVKKRGLDVPRNVVPLMKIRVADLEPKGGNKAMITIWKPNETLQEMLTEGTWIDVYNLFPTSVRYSELQISAGRQSVFQRSKINDTDKLKVLTRTLRRQCYTIKELQNPSMNTDYNEIDTFGLIFMIEPQTNEFETSKQPFQNMYLTDENKNMICVNFWGGVEKFGFQNILDIGQVVTCVNLQKRAGNTKKNIPQYRATEFTYFTKISKIDAVRKIADDLAAKFSSLDKRKFIDDCIALKNNYHKIKSVNIENVSPYRLNTSDYNVYKNKVFIDSPLVNKCTDVNLNLTGIDFESTFKQKDTQDMSPQMLLRKQKVKEKIARLKMYGEPPPLTPMHLINKSSNAVRAYKSPFTNDVSKCIASPSVLPQNRVENTEDYHQNCKVSEYGVTSLRGLPQNRIECKSSVTSSHTVPNETINKNNSIDSSPVLGLKRTYAKRPSINPVKLNFSNAIDTSMTDAFGEEFEDSPPLSLDANFIT